MSDAQVIRYGEQWVDDADAAAVLAALRSDWLTQGPAVELFEADLARRADPTGATRAVAVSNGTAALHLALLALGIGPGKRVLTSANTFLASATSALLCGAEVEFVDVDPATGNMDAELVAQRVARAPRIDLVVAVHFAGLPCDMERLIELAREHGFALVEDACHALGASYRAHGRDWHPGAHPEVAAAALSFHPVKHITTGEGGAVFARADLARRVRSLRSHGMERDSAERPFEDGPARAAWFAPMQELGLNYRLSDLQAALGRSQLGKLDAFLRRRTELAERYDHALRGTAPEWRTPELRSGHAWHLYPIRVAAAERDELMAALADRGIGTQVHYYPVPHQPWFRRRYGTPSVPRALEHARTCLSLPLHPGLQERDQERVIDALLAWRRA